MGLRFVLIFSLTFGSLKATALDLSQSDKQLHLGLSLAATQVGYLGLKTIGWKKKKALFTAAFLTFAAGFAKEIRDTKADDEDLQADALGVALGAIGPILIYEW